MATCTISGTISSLATGDLVRWKYLAPQSMSSETLIASGAWSTTTTASGVFSFAAEQGSKIRVVADAAKLDITFDVPEQSTYELSKAVNEREEYHR